MAIDPTAPRTRRAVIGAALGGAAAAAATSLAGPLSVRAATDGNVILGQGNDAGENEADAPTIVKNLTDAQVSLAGQHAAAGTGVSGSAVTGIGVKGVSTDATASAYPSGSFRTGVYGATGDTSLASDNTDETGTYGYSDVSLGSAGVWGQSIQGVGVLGTGDWAVYGIAGSAGVVGDADATGTGVVGFSGDTAIPLLPAGVGVFAAAASTTQTALQVSGKVKFSRSGRVSSTKTATYKKVLMTGVTTASYVIATLQTSVTGCYVRAVVPTAGSFTIYLSKAPGKAVYIGYMVIN
jgi:hypothetical protein